MAVAALRVKEPGSAKTKAELQAELVEENERLAEIEELLRKTKDQLVVLRATEKKDFQDFETVTKAVYDGLAKNGALWAVKKVQSFRSGAKLREKIERLERSLELHKATKQQRLNRIDAIRKGLFNLEVDEAASLAYQAWQTWKEDFSRAKASFSKLTKAVLEARRKERGFAERLVNFGVNDEFFTRSTCWLNDEATHSLNMAKFADRLGSVRDSDNPFYDPTIRTASGIRGFSNTFADLLKKE